MRESSDIDSMSGDPMPRPYSQDLRARLIEAVEAGASRREAAERYEISASAGVLWTQRRKETGSFAAEPRRQRLSARAACGMVAGSDREISCVMWVMLAREWNLL